ncbi:family 20 glycosylhydrolase [Mucilaginibacter gossypii]|uniref:glycoside hydrolase family 20 protein n=1 Tax=Mucilaginibacter gossypii TaxID=551996 RepID=UPI000DCBE60D|nr:MULTISPECIES: family 20 glycosylhydrolase [Mucilaginibacter]QTE37111.1 family 20 glycosylhydrolase [Mucilaginibacter gossypii]RAV59091.1 beta-hexosaminidase [Mucilaginibacter rubeus]
MISYNLFFSRPIKTVAFVLCVAFALPGKAQIYKQGVIPQPVKIKSDNINYTFPREFVIGLGPGIKASNVTFFRHYINLARDIHETEPFVNHKKATSNLWLQLDPKSISQPEGYTLMVKPHQIIITGHDEAGVFYGLQSLIQLLDIDKSKITVKGYTVTDYPRFAYRGMHLDVSRHFFKPEAIKKWIDLLALYKINTFHWHLTDDQGWRIEIKKYPLLQSISAYRDETIIGHKKDSPHRFDGKRYGGYYTQDEVKEIVKYATQRHITVIPEIEMPGHALAALAAYPQLGCTGGPYKTATYWGIFDDVYCAGNDETFTFLQNVMNEVLPLFPSKYIHIGGDECPKTKWKVCPKCQQRIKEEHLKDEKELQSYFIGRMEKYLNSKGRQIIGWDEILEGGLTPGATVMSWTGEEGGIAAAKQHHDAIMTPEKYVYLDYYQSLYPAEPLAGGGYTPLSKVYNYEPITNELSGEEAKYIKGVQANAWSEYMASPAQAERQLFPRMLALAEVAWSSKKNKSYPDFLKRLRYQQHLLEKLNINAADVFDEITDSVIETANHQVALNLQTTLPGAKIFYTTDGTEPGLNSQGYTGAITIASSGIIKAAVFNNGRQQGRTYEKSFSIHKAIGKTVTLKNQPQGGFNPGNTFGLVNGIFGSKLYNDGQWYGFSGDDLEAVVDLGNEQSISKLGINILKYHWQKMWEPTLLTFEVSTDGSNYTEVYRQTDFPDNGINAVRANIKTQQARYIRVKATNKGIIPPGGYIPGAKAWLMVDEIIVN